MPIRIVLADDHHLVLGGLEHLFETEPDMTVVARGMDGVEALAAVREQRPDILILDLAMPNANGLDVLRALHAEGLPPRVVILTASVEDDEVLEAVRLGAKGLMLKHMAPQLLVQCVRKVHDGGQWLEKETVGRALERLLKRASHKQRLSEVLTEREREIVRLIIDGDRNKEIAYRLQITEGTVKGHVHNVYQKLGVGSRMELSALMRETDLAD